MTDVPSTMKAMRSLIKEDGTVELALHDAPVPEPGPNQVLVRVEATPINPSDLAMMFGMADLQGGAQGGTAENPVLMGKLPPQAVAMMQARIGKAIPLGNEGAGVVVKAGPGELGQAYLGKTVATFGGGLYAEYRLADVATVMPLADGVTAKEGASSFVNPMTALGMVETMRMEGHSALVHTAAASNLGQMLNRICQADGVPLVNVVRKAEQEALLRGIGATHVVNSSEPDFFEKLLAAIDETGATLSFDAVGGGALAGTILQAMVAAQNAKVTEYTFYGAPVRTQVYVYGRLDFGPIEIPPSVGMFWHAGGWLLTDFLGKVGLEGQMRLAGRVISEIKTTFASAYTDEISLAGALELSVAERYAKRATGEKFLITPNG
ncbi:MAG: zinc-binding dehydrogenase [Pseudomonadota bacterium]